MRVALYIRVSTKRQKHENQQPKLEEFAKDMKWTRGSPVRGPRFRRQGRQARVQKDVRRRIQGASSTSYSSGPLTDSAVKASSRCSRICSTWTNWAWLAQLHRTVP
jgi:hypothetical protein